MPRWHGMGHGGVRRAGSPGCTMAHPGAVERSREGYVRDRYSRTLRILLRVMMNWNRNCFVARCGRGSRGPRYDGRVAVGTIIRSIIAVARLSGVSRRCARVARGRETPPRGAGTVTAYRSGSRRGQIRGRAVPGADTTRHMVCAEHVGAAAPAALRRRSLHVLLDILFGLGFVARVRHGHP